MRKVISLGFIGCLFITLPVNSMASDFATMFTDDLGQRRTKTLEISKSLMLVNINNAITNIKYIAKEKYILPYFSHPSFHLPSSLPNKDLNWIIK